MTLHDVNVNQFIVSNIFEYSGNLIAWPWPCRGLGLGLGLPWLGLGLGLGRVAAVTRLADCLSASDSVDEWHSHRHSESYTATGDQCQ